MGHSKHDGRPVEVGGRCSTCGKVQYLSKSGAKQAAQRIRGRGAGKGLTAYRCSSGFWHLGHLPPFVKSGDVDRRVLRSNP